MAKKLGKIVLFTAAVASVATAVYYFMQKKERENEIAEEEDFDDFSEDAEKASESTRTYVPLNSDASSEEGTSDSDAAEKEKDNAFTPLAEQVSQAEEKTVETVEEFFDEEDDAEDEPPISDSKE